MPVLRRFGQFHEVNRLLECSEQGDLQFIGRSPEELLAQIYTIDAQLVEVLMKFRFQAICIVAEDKCVSIELKWHRRIAELIYAVLGVEPSGYSYLEDAFPECADV